MTQFDNPWLRTQGNPLLRLGDLFLFAADHDLTATLYALDVRSGVVSELASGLQANARRMRLLHRAETHVVLTTEAGLLQTDGTPTGTRLWDIEVDHWATRAHVTRNGVTFFTPGSPRPGELWTTDGTEEGTGFIERLCPREQGCDDPYSFVASDDAVYFLHEPQGLWRSDGTPEGTIWISQQPSLLDELELLASNRETLILEVQRRYPDRTRARSLWLFDTTRDHFVELLDKAAWEGSNLDDIANGRIMGDRFVFVAERPDVGGELFFVDLENPRGVFTSSIETDPLSIDLTTPYPNPASSIVHFGLSLPRATNVHLDIVDLLGRRVAVLHDGWMSAGGNDLVTSMHGLAAGVYLIRARTGGHVQSQQIVISR